MYAICNTENFILYIYEIRVMKKKITVKSKTDCGSLHLLREVQNAYLLVYHFPLCKKKNRSFITFATDRPLPHKAHS